MRRFSLRRFSLRRFSLRRFSLRSLHCGAFTAEPSLRTLTVDLQRGNCPSRLPYWTGFPLCMWSHTQHSCQLSLFQRDSPKGLSLQRFEDFYCRPSKDLRISIVVPPTDVGYNNHNMEMYWPYNYGNVPTFDPQIPLFLNLPTNFFTDVSLLLVLAGWQLCIGLISKRVFPFFFCGWASWFLSLCMWKHGKSSPIVWKQETGDTFRSTRGTWTWSWQSVFPNGPNK